MNRPSRRSGRFAILALVLLLLPACTSPEEIRAQTRESRKQVRALSERVLGEMATLGPIEQARGSWSACGDLGGKVLYQVTARLMAPPRDRAGAETLIVRVEERLTAAGLPLHRAYPQDPDPVILEVVRNQVNVQVLDFSEEGYVVLDTTGPCLKVNELDLEFMDVPVEPVPYERP